MKVFAPLSASTVLGIVPADICHGILIAGINKGLHGLTWHVAKYPLLQHVTNQHVCFAVTKAS